MVIFLFHKEVDPIQKLAHLFFVDCVGVVLNNLMSRSSPTKEARVETPKIIKIKYCTTKVLHVFSPGLHHSKYTGAEALRSPPLTSLNHIA